MKDMIGGVHFSIWGVMMVLSGSERDHQQLLAISKQSTRRLFLFGWVVIHFVPPAAE